MHVGENLLSNKTSFTTDFGKNHTFIWSKGKNTEGDVSVSIEYAYPLHKVNWYHRTLDHYDESIWESKKACKTVMFNGAKGAGTWWAGEVLAICTGLVNANIHTAC